MRLLEDFARWNPAQESTDSRTELMSNLVQSCKKQAIRNELATGSTADHAVNAIWAVMIYHTPVLLHALKTYGNAYLISALIAQSPYYLLIVVLDNELIRIVLVSLSKIFFFCFTISCLVNQECKSCINEDFVQVYSMADSIRTWMVSFTGSTTLYELLLNLQCM